MIDNDTYRRKIGATTSPYILPKLVIDKLVLQEIAYQTFINGPGAILSVAKKALFPPILSIAKKALFPSFLVLIGAYDISNIKDGKEEAYTIEFFHFG